MDNHGTTVTVHMADAIARVDSPTASQKKWLKIDKCFVEHLFHEDLGRPFSEMGAYADWIQSCLISVTCNASCSIEDSRSAVKSLEVYSARQKGNSDTDTAAIKSLRHHDVYRELYRNMLESFQDKESGHSNSSSTESSTVAGAKSTGNQENNDADDDDDKPLLRIHLSSTVEETTPRIEISSFSWL